MAETTICMKFISYISFAWVFACISSCTPTAPDPDGDAITADDQVESSLNPLVFLAGDYVLNGQDNVAAPLAVRQPEKLTGIVAGVVSYTLTLKAIGDSLNMTLNGRGVAGTYVDLNLGNFAVFASAGNPEKPTFNNLGQSNGQYRYTLYKTTIGDLGPTIDRDMTRRRDTRYALNLTIYPDDNLMPTRRLRAYRRNFDLISAWGGYLNRNTPGYWR